VFPSAWNEPSGLPTFEAQACGTPVFSTYSGGIPEYVSHLRNGTLVVRAEAKEPVTAISQVLDNPALACHGRGGATMGGGAVSWDVVPPRLADLAESAPPAASQAGKRKTAAQVAASGEWQLLYREVDRFPTAWIAAPIVIGPTRFGLGN
jgi:Glycosyl transferases group 1